MKCWESWKGDEDKEVVRKAERRLYHASCEN
jgi:hypothetical protein